MKLFFLSPICLCQRNGTLSHILADIFIPPHPMSYFRDVSLHPFQTISLLTFPFFFFSGWALQQSPDTVVYEGDALILNCSEKKESALLTMYWYKLPVGKNATLQLIVNSVEGGRAEIEKEFINHFHSSGTKSSCLSVETTHVLLNDSGTYFCAKQDTL